MYLDNCKNRIKKSKVKITGADFHILYHCEIGTMLLIVVAWQSRLDRSLLADQVIAMNIAACH